MAGRKHITRGLRFTLTAVYTLVFTLLLVAVTLYFRQTLANSLDEQAHDDLEENWAVVKAYLRIVNDPGQRNYHPGLAIRRGTTRMRKSAVASVQKVYFIARTGTGHVLPE